jgi:hypothetical protein
MQNTIETELKKKVLEAIVADKLTFAGSEAQHAKSLGINGSVYSQLKNGKNDAALLSKAAWITLARRFDIAIGSQMTFTTANTTVYETIATQMQFCAENSLSAVFCDESDIGKTHTAKEVVKRTRNAVYIDCSYYKTKQLLVRAIAQSYGIDSAGSYHECKSNLVYYIKTLDRPLIVLDEFGDLVYEAFLEIKALWNATEGACAWYALGADGLKVKIERGRNGKKVGFTEFFRRFGNRYQSVVPAGKDDKHAFKTNLVVAFLKANLPAGADIQKILPRCNNSLTRAKIEVLKFKKAA